MHKTRAAAVALAYSLVASNAHGSAAEGVAAARRSGLTIHVKNFAFSPTPAKIDAGEQVTFVNDDDEAHTVTANDKAFDSAGLDGGQTWHHVFAKPGTYDYFCELHPYMKAQIVVSPANGAPKSPAR